MSYPSVILVGNETDGYFPRLLLDADTAANPSALIELKAGHSDGRDNGETVRATFTISDDTGENASSVTLSWRGKTASTTLSKTSSLAPYEMMNDSAFTLAVTVAKGMTSGFDPGWSSTQDGTSTTFTLDPYVRVRRKSYSLTAAPQS
jgi:hypothetical protein